jgi:hypothetical protein
MNILSELWRLGRAFEVGQSWSHKGKVTPIEVDMPPCDSCGKSDGTYLVAWIFHNAVGKANAIAAAKRIVACVNACRGLTDEQLQKGVIPRA